MSGKIGGTGLLMLIIGVLILGLNGAFFIGIILIIAGLILFASNPPDWQNKFLR